MKIKEMIDKMRRKRMTEVFPFLLPLRKFQRRLFFYIKMYFDGHRYSRDKVGERLEHLVYESSSLIVNKNSGYDIQFQLNKGHNLKLASTTINRLVIKPNETFSFWRLVRQADKYEPYKDGLNLVNGQIVGSYGGGLCQLSNMLYWMFLHTPLTIIERHPHRVQNFAPAGNNMPTGIDATVSEGWSDLRVKNETQSIFQIIISFDNKSIHGSILSDMKGLIDYEIFNKDIQYINRKGRIIEESSVYRRETHSETKEVKEVFLYKNETEIAYELDSSIEIF